MGDVMDWICRNNSKNSNQHNLLQSHASVGLLILSLIVAQGPTTEFGNYTDRMGVVTRLPPKYATGGYF